MFARSPLKNTSRCHLSFLRKLEQNERIRLNESYKHMTVQEIFILIYSKLV